MTHVEIISHQDNSEWARVFEEVAQAFDDALTGTKVKLAFGAHLLAKDDPALKGHTLYQSEQIIPGNEWVTPAYLDILKRHNVWDYSPANIKALKKHGVKAKLVPVRYMPSMTRFQCLPPEQQDIDVLFYGSTNKRRILILNDLIRAGCRVHKIYSVFGAERDAWIARSKIVLNTHNRDGGIFEIFRCAHLFANSKCVVSETGSDPKLEALYKDCASFCSREEVVATCVDLLRNDAKRLRREFMALENFKTPLLSAAI